MFKSNKIIKTTGIIFLMVGFGMVFLHSYPDNWIFNKIIHELYANFSAEFISIAITILLINYLYDLKEKQNLKRRLIRELGSEQKVISSNALLEIKENGWLTDGSLKNAKLSNADLSNQDLTGANLEGVNLENAELSNAILKNANLTSSTLSKAILSNANLENATIDNSKMHGTQFYESKLNKIEAKNVDLMNSNLKLAQLSECTFTESRFEDVDLALSTLTDSKFINCNLLRTNFQSTNIKGSYFERCNIDSIKNWKEIEKRTKDSFMAPTNPPTDFLNFNNDGNE